MYVEGQEILMENGNGAHRKLLADDKMARKTLVLDAGLMPYGMIIYQILSRQSQKATLTFLFHFQSSISMMEFLHLWEER